MDVNNNLSYMRFGDLSLNDPFFDSLKSGYAEFPDWFMRKSDEKAYVIFDENHLLQAFVYLKEENEAIEDVEPPLPNDKYLKIGTFKINAHGTKLGERFIKKSFDHALSNDIKKIYVTVFSEHQPLIALFQRFGFVHVASKTTHNGVELVLLKIIGNTDGSVENSANPAIA